MNTKAIEELIASPADLLEEDSYQLILESVLSAFAFTTGTIHSFNTETELLELKAHQGIPEFLLEKVSLIPVGKGIAGAAAKKREPVQLCNLQTDTSGVARPDAKYTKVSGSIAVPVLHSDALKGTLGIGLQEPYDFSPEEIEVLDRVADWLAQSI